MDNRGVESRLRIRESQFKLELFLIKHGFWGQARMSASGRKQPSVTTALDPKRTFMDGNYVPGELIARWLGDYLRFRTKWVENGNKQPTKYPETTYK